MLAKDLTIKTAEESIEALKAQQIYAETKENAQAVQLNNEKDLLQEEIALLKAKN